MIDLLACIGFDVRDPDALRGLLLQLAADADERLVTPVGEYAIWRSRSGAELWFHVAAETDDSGEREIVGMTPFFEGTSEQRLEVVSFELSNDSPFEGVCRARGGDASAPTELCFLVIDAAAVGDAQLASRKAFRVSGFATSLECLEADEPSASRSIEPNADHNIPHATLRGRITSMSTLRNEASKGSFVCMSLDCNGIELDLITEKQTSEHIREGASIEADCYLIGRMLD